MEAVIIFLAWQFNRPPERSQPLLGFRRNPCYKSRTGTARKCISSFSRYCGANIPFFSGGSECSLPSSGDFGCLAPPRGPRPEKPEILESPHSVTRLLPPGTAGIVSTVKPTESVEPVTGRACEIIKYLLATELSPREFENGRSLAARLRSVRKLKSLESNGSDLHNCGFMP